MRCTFSWYAVLPPPSVRRAEARLQADEAFCIGPAPSAESYVSSAQHLCMHSEVRMSFTAANRQDH